MSDKYSIGVDFGTLSGRTVLVNLRTGEEAATAIKEYRHGVMDEYLPDGITKLPPDFALQHPADYLDVFEYTIPKVMNEANVSPDDVVGIAVDFTACTVLPVDGGGEPLCFKPEHASNPHAYVKLWKHHAAQDEANKLNETAERIGESFLQRYGGKISSEWMVPKAWQILDEAPGIYGECAAIIEATDWVTMQLTGVMARSSCTAGYKALWSKKDGYPPRSFYGALDPRFADFVDEKLSRDIKPIGSKAGEISAKAAKLTGLREGTAVAIGNVDAHVSLPAVGISGPGKMLMIMGTSTCHIMLGKTEVNVPGMCGVVEDGVIPGFPAYEAGQSCVGDHFEWFAENCVPDGYVAAAKAKGQSIHDYLSDKADALSPGQSGLLALDWWNGNRSVLVDVDLTGMLLGCTLLTKPEEIYRALVEATAYGTRVIIEAFEKSGLPVDELFACGGIAEKNPMIMQIYADVTNREIKISGSSQAPALGSAMFGAVAAGKERGGFDTIGEAARVMARVKESVYMPVPENAAAYEKLFAEYKKLHDYFGTGGNDVMKRLKEIKKEALAN